MIRLFSLVAAFGLLASCAQYQEPQANCFSFLAAVAPVEQTTPDCHFSPLKGPEDDIEA